jgi:hypothetical protein
MAGVSGTVYNDLNQNGRRHDIHRTTGDPASSASFAASTVAELIDEVIPTSRR